MSRMLLGIFLFAACGEPAPVSIEAAPLGLSAEQENHCARLERQGEPTPWWCGRREGALSPPFAEACPDRQWIGYRIEAMACPAAPSAFGTWSVDEPFARSRHARLRRLCRYEWTPNLPERPTPDVDALPDEREMRLERDCEVVTGHAVPQPVADELFSAWSEQVEAPDWSAAAPFAAPRVRVAIIDGGRGPEASGGAAPDTMDHAVMVSSVVRALTCPDQGAGPFCAASVPNYNAMPYVLPGIEGELGGFFGTQAGFAAAVAEAVDAWRLEPLVSRPRHLVLNLSLGWDGAYDVSAAERIPGAAALWAAQYASCEGALLIAAAGNRAAEGDQGPLFPAAWEALPRACGEPAGLYSPLVHAVGAVDGRDAVLGISREGANPRLVAAGALVVVPEDTALPGTEPSVVLSGTSVAAASASGAAALIWSLRPNLSPDAVMEVLYRSGEPLGLPAQFGAPAQRRRLSVARAFQRACPPNVAIGACPAAQSRPALPAPRAAGVDAQADFEALVALLYPQADDAVEAPPAPLPELESAYFAPWVVPQPGEPNCPICGFIGTTLHGKLAESLQGAALGQPWVLVYDEFNNKTYIGLDTLPPATAFKIDLYNTLNGKVIKSAWLQIPAILNGKSVLTSSELFVD